jgi:hypothetical protein
MPGRYATALFELANEADASIRSKPTLTASTGCWMNRATCIG